MQPPWKQVPALAAASITEEAVPQQQATDDQQNEKEELSKQAAARFEIVLNQIDKAKARVRHEKEKLEEFQKTIQGTQSFQQQPNSEEPNALTDQGQTMPEYEEKPPGDDNTGTLHWTLCLSVKCCMLNPCLLTLLGEAGLVQW